ESLSGYGCEQGEEHRANDGPRGATAEPTMARLHHRGAHGPLSRVCQNRAANTQLPGITAVTPNVTKCQKSKGRNARTRCYCTLGALYFPAKTAARDLGRQFTCSSRPTTKTQAMKPRIRTATVTAKAARKWPVLSTTNPVRIGPTRPAKLPIPFCSPVHL